MKRLLQALLVLVFLAAATSAVLYLIQGGIGAGQFPFDRGIGVLGLPWLLIMPWPRFADRFTFLWVVVLPFVINLSIVSALMALWLRLRAPG